MAAWERVHFASRSEIGRVRDSNQDAFGEFEDPERGLLLVVADGMGGHRGGATASRLAVEVIGEVFRASGESPERMLRAAVGEANRRVHERGEGDPRLQGMGTTVVALHLGPAGAAWVAHVGDSRLYRLRDGALEALTQDHSLVAELERQGYLTREEAFVHPRRNELLRSVGSEATVAVDVAPARLAGGDRLLLCSDGLCGYVEDAAIARALAAAASPAEAADALLALADRSGGADNVTVQVLDVPG